MEAIDSSGKERMISLIVLTVTGEKGIPFYVIQKKKLPAFLILVILTALLN
jgi:hypothetical protein